MVGKEKQGMLSRMQRFEKPTGRVDIEREMISIIGEEGWIVLNREAQIAINGGDGRQAGLTAMAWSIHMRSVAITEIERQLIELNEKFPGERMKDSPKQDPSFRDTREHLLQVKQLLTPMQREDRKVIRDELKRREKRKRDDNYRVPL